MSPSKRSKPESASSPEIGGEPSDQAEGSEAIPAPRTQPRIADDKDEPRPGGPLEVELEVSRQRAGGWAVFGIIIGALLIWKLGTVGVWAGVVLIVVGVFRAWELAQTFLYPPGTIAVTADSVILPRGLCLPRPLTVKPSDVTAVYFLRRSVPWNRSAPVLVVELGARALAYPRDWFASEADQRHIVHALMRTTEAVTEATPGPVDVGEDRAALAQIIGGGLLLAGSIVGAALAGGHLTDDGARYALYIAPAVVGLIVFWRGLSRR